MNLRRIALAVCLFALMGCPDDTPEAPKVDANTNWERCQQRGLIEGAKGWLECLEQECRESGGEPQLDGHVCEGGRKVRPGKQDEAVASEPKQECPDGRMIYEWNPSEARCMDNYCPTPPSGHVWTLKWGYQDSRKTATVFCNELGQLSRFCQMYPLTPNPSGPQRVFWCEPERTNK